MWDDFDRVVNKALGCLLGVIVSAIAALVAAVIGVLFGRWQNQQAVKRSQERQLRYPGTLEVPYDFTPGSTSLPLDPRPWRARHAGGLMAATGFISISSIVGFLASLDPPPGTETGLKPLLAAVVAGIAGYATVRLWHLRKQSSVPLIITLPEHPANEPLNLSQVRAYAVKVPSTNAWHPETAARFMEQVLEKYHMLTFQILAEPDSLTWRILDHRRRLDPSVMKQTICAFYPDAEVEEAEFASAPFEDAFCRYIMSFEQTAEPVFPIAYVETFKQLDPLANLTQELSHLQQGERVTYTLFVADSARFLYQQAENLLTFKPGSNPFKLLSPEGWAEAGYSLATGEKQRLSVYEDKDQEVILRKFTNFVYQCLLLIQIDAPTFDRVEALTRLNTFIQQYRNLPYGALAWHEGVPEDGVYHVETPEHDSDTSTFGLLNRWLTNTGTEWHAIRLLLDTRELAGLWHLPNTLFQASQIAWSRKGARLPQPMYGYREGVCLGESHFGGVSEPVYMPDQDRATHINILGMTGVGKSTLMHHLITQDIARGSGVAVIDPHGQLVRDILQTGIPEAREGDVVVLDLANVEYPPPLNPMASTRNEAATARIISVLEKIYGRPENAPRMANALSSALITLRHEPQATVRDIARLFLDAEFRQALLEKVTDEVALEFWEYEYEGASPGQQLQIRDPVLYRVRAFYRNADLYPIICHPQGLDFAQLMEDGKIILLSLGMDEERIPESERNLMGAIVVSQLQMAAMKRRNTSRPFYLYIDEVQNFVTSSLDKVFSEARKFELPLTVANQYLKQLSGETLDAMMGNVGAMVVFQCGLDDARRLAPYMKPGFEAEDLVNLDKFQAVVKMRFNEKTQSAFSLSPLPPRTAETLAPEERFKCTQAELRIRQLSQATYTPMHRDEVQAWLAERYPRRRPRLGKADEGVFYES